MADVKELVVDLGVCMLLDALLNFLMLVAVDGFVVSLVVGETGDTGIDDGNDSTPVDRALETRLVPATG